jgi:1-acyl-sn-glycerol-3-phosphate acyltransferase
MPFRLGAFQIAAERRLPVLPVALRGTRTVWPDESLRLRPAALTVAVGEPLTAADSGWTATVALRDAARTWISTACGEPTVDRGAVMIDGPASPSASD